MNAPAATSKPATLEELMAHAFAIERDAVERYTEFADVMQTHNNGEVAALFRQLAEHEGRHAEQILEKMRWSGPRAVHAVPIVEQLHVEAPSLEQAHYLMQPWHALNIALAAERSARDFFGELAQRCEDDQLRQAALELQADEQQHVSLLEEWLARVPPPQQGWDEDPDPPRYSDL